MSQPLSKVQFLTKTIKAYVHTKQYSENLSLEDAVEALERARLELLEDQERAKQRLIDEEFRVWVNRRDANPALEKAKLKRLGKLGAYEEHDT